MTNDMPKIDHILLITIDSLRADHLAAYGYPRVTAPFLDTLATDGVQFMAAFSNAPYTTASVMSLITSTYPLIARGRDFHISQFLTLASVLSGHNVQTIGVHSNPWFTLYKFGEGFSTFIDPLTLSKEQFKFNYARAEEINLTTIDLFSKMAARSFTWVHYMDVHEPYTPPEIHFGEGLTSDLEYAVHMKRLEQPQEVSHAERTHITDLYDNTISCLNGPIQSLVTSFCEACGNRTGLVIITSDHGEALGERGYYGHGGRDRPIGLYDENLHVPLIVWSPSAEVVQTIRAKLGGSKVAGQVALLDVAPMILDLFNLPVPEEFMGLSPLTHGTGRDIISQGLQIRRPNQLDFMYAHRGGTVLCALRTDQYKVVLKNRDAMLFDLACDPEETTNTIKTHQDTAQVMRSRLKKVLEVAGKEHRMLEAKRLIAHLARGYSFDRRILALKGTIEEEDLVEADRALTQTPESANAWCERGIALRDLGRHDEAIEALNHALKIDPSFALAWSELGVTFRKMGRDADAVEAFSSALKIDPSLDAAWSELGVTLRKMGRDADAIEAFSSALKIDPSLDAAWSELGVTLRKMNRSEEAVTAFEKAIAINPASAPTWREKSMALRRTERYGEALAAIDQSILLEPSSAEAYIQKSFLNRKMGDFKDSLNAADEAIRIEPRSGDAWIHKGFALRKMNLDSEALQAFDQAIALDASNSEAWRNRGFTLKKMGREEEARSAVAKVKELERMGSAMGITPHSSE